MNKFQYIKDCLEEMGLDYSINASFIKDRNSYFVFDFYLKKPYKLVINYKEKPSSIDGILKNGFTIIDFSKVDPSANIIESTIESLGSITIQHINLFSNLFNTISSNNHSTNNPF